MKTCSKCGRSRALAFLEKVMDDWHCKASRSCKRARDESKGGR